MTKPCLGLSSKRADLASAARLHTVKLQPANLKPRPVVLRPGLVAGHHNVCAEAVHRQRRLQALVQIPQGLLRSTTSGDLQTFRSQGGQSNLLAPLSRCRKRNTGANRSPQLSSGSGSHRRMCSRSPSQTQGQPGGAQGRRQRLPRQPSLRDPNPSGHTVAKVCGCPANQPNPCFPLFPPKLYKSALHLPVYIFTKLSQWQGLASTTPSVLTAYFASLQRLIIEEGKRTTARTVSPSRTHTQQAHLAPALCRKRGFVA